MPAWAAVLTLGLAAVGRTVRAAPPQTVQPLPLLMGIFLQTAKTLHILRGLFPQPLHPGRAVSQRMPDDKSLYP